MLVIGLLQDMEKLKKIIRKSESKGKANELTKNGKRKNLRNR